jgi:uncharacterized phage protein gp47/JayE
LAAPADREWTINRRGELREAQLRDFREGLRLQIDPETRQLFTESVIRQVTAKGSRFWTHAEAIDLLLLGVERRDEWFAQQLHIDRAGTAFLESYHSKTWDEARLPAFGGSGNAAATGIAGTTWQGSTTVPDDFAQVALDPASNRYQVLVTAVADGSGAATVTLVGIDGGDETNPAAGTILKWVSPPPGSAPELTVLATFRGGLDAETDAALAKRIIDRLRHKPASGNWSHIRSYARAASVSVEDAFVYPCAFHAGSELVAVTQKRGDAAGPLARIPEVGVLAAVTAALVPPGSVLVPGRVHVVVVPPVPQSTNLVVQLAQPLGSVAGFTDIEPFPAVNGSTACAITTVTTQLDFRITASGAGQLPQGASSATDVHVMVWVATTSSFESLAVASVTDLGAGIYRVQLVTPPAHTLAVGDWVSPDMTRRDVLAAAVSTYFDSLGPGEVIDLATDERGSRAYRNPVPSEEYPQRAGQGVVSIVSEALGTPIADATLASVSAATPTLPIDPVLGPSLLVAGRFGVYALA